jgi:hypothetical protein
LQNFKHAAINQFRVQVGQEASNQLRRRAEQQRDTLDNQFRFAQSQTEELLKTVASLEQAKHKIEQQAQEETLQLRQRLLEQAQSSKVCLSELKVSVLTGQRLPNNNRKVYHIRAAIGDRSSQCSKRIEAVATSARSSSTGEAGPAESNQHSSKANTKVSQEFLSA